MAVNIAFVAGNSALRIEALGWEEVPADGRAVDRMRATLGEAMEEGAFGVSSGLDYPPGSYASTEELAQLTAEAAKFGGIYHTHVRYTLGDRFLDPFREAIEIGARGGGPAHITHFYHRSGYPGGPEQLLGLVEEARARGQDVTYDSYPYAAGSTLVFAGEKEEPLLGVTVLESTGLWLDPQHERLIPRRPKRKSSGKRN